MKHKLPICLWLLFASLYLNAQDIHYSQYNEAPLLLNPALAGTAINPVRVTLNYRNQWPTIGNAYNTIAASVDLPVGDNGTSRRPLPHLGAGFSFFRDQAGEAKLGTTTGALTLAGVVPLSEYHKLSAGIQGGLAQRTGDVNKLSWGSQFVNGGYSGDYPSGEFDNLSSPAYADISTGIYYQFSSVAERFLQEDVIKIMAGMAFYHVNQPVTTYGGFTGQKLNQKTMYMLSGQFDFPDSKYSLLPSFVHWKQGAYSETVFGMLFKMRLIEASKFTGLNEQSSFALGASYRTNDAIIFEAHYQVSSYTFGFSYDANISKLISASKSVGAAELVLKYAPGRKTFKGK
ncbi:MAG: PorP/SprF family type IX secretion system membrane protein [Bacteroidia bacterium]